MAEFKTITTQEEFDAAIKDRIERAEKKTREAVAAEFKGWVKPADIEALKETHAAEIKRLADDHTKALEKYAGYDEKFKEFEAKIKGYEIRELKTKAATAYKLPLDAIEFLQGDDEKAINESAERLMNLTGANHGVGMTRNTEPTADAAGVWRELANNIFK